MDQVGLRSYQRWILVALLLAGVVITIAPSRAVADVTAVSGSASGYSLSVSLFGGTIHAEGPTPTVTLPAGGSAAPVTATAPSANAFFGPATFFTSDQLDVSTQATTGPGGSVSSSASITNVGKGGSEVFTATKVTSTCTISDAGIQESTTITGGVLQTDSGDVNPPVHPVVTVPVDVNPAPNTSISGHIHVNGAQDNFHFIINEQVTNPDGSITVTAAHQVFDGPTAVGDLLIGQSTCGATVVAGATTTTTTPAGGTTTTSPGATTTTTAPSGSTTTTAASTTTSTTTAATTTTTVSCHPLTDAGKCYAPGEFCRTSDLGTTGVAGNGTPIICVDNNGLRWEPTSTAASTTSTTLNVQVGGSAFGYYTSVGLFGGPQAVRGPIPKVTLPSGGSSTPVSASAATEIAQYGPAIIFQSGPETVTTQGTPGTAGSVISSASIEACATATVNGCDVGQIYGGPFLASTAKSTCTADQSGVTGSATFANAKLVTKTDPTTGDPVTTVPVPNNPPANYTVNGTIDNVNGTFKYVLNEQIKNPDGSLTVNAGHEYLGAGAPAGSDGGPAKGDLIFGQSVCLRGATTSSNGGGGGGGSQTGSAANTSNPLATTGRDVLLLLKLALVLLATGWAATRGTANSGERGRSTIE